MIKIPYWNIQEVLVAALLLILQAKQKKSQKTPACKRVCHPPPEAT